MGIYLNGTSAHGLFRKECRLPYYVDKSQILEELVAAIEIDEDNGEDVPLSDVDVTDGQELNNDTCSNGDDTEPGQLDIKTNPRYICITRPRRFGKTIMANMIASYFGKGTESREFDSLKVSSYDWYETHRNKHNVIHIMFNEMPDGAYSYEKYIARIKRRLIADLRRAYPEAGIEQDDAVWDALTNIYEFCGGEQFVFVLDEWDYIYHQKFVTEEEKDYFTKFLSNLLKDKAYVELAYMTGILPIAKYSSGSELNMFCEYTMVTEEKFSECFGFTDAEVDALYDKYRRVKGSNSAVTREGLRLWYDGYHTKKGERVYNPRSVVLALTNNNLGSYWTSSGPYDELFYYIGANVDQVREDVGMLVADVPVPAKVREYAATSMELKTKDEIFSAMVVYGFLNYEDGCVSIPNRELMEKFAEMVQKEESLGNVYRLTKESGRMLRATKAGDTKTMTEILQFVHNTESPLLVYNNEAELASIIRWVYLEAINYYQIEREDMPKHTGKCSGGAFHRKAGVGYVDYVFYPIRKDDDAIIIELKVNHTAEEAIEQIKNRQYLLRFEGKLGQPTEYTGRVLAVGIGYDKDDTAKRHECKVEVLREKI